MEELSLTTKIWAPLSFARDFYHILSPKQVSETSMEGEHRVATMAEKNMHSHIYYTAESYNHCQLGISTFLSRA